MRRTRAPFAATLLIAWLAGGCAFSVDRSTVARAAGASAELPAVSFTGASSHVVEPAFHKITDAREFAKVWVEHRTGSSPKGSYNYNWNYANVPVVDFEDYMVIAIFQGKSANSNGFHVEELVDDGDVFRVRYDSMSYQTSEGSGRARRVRKVTPYGIFVVPKTDRPVVLELDTQNMLGRPPIWTERARL